MLLDARGLGEKEAFLKIKESLRAGCGEEVKMDVLVSAEKTARKMRAFMEMSGCVTLLEKNEEGWILKMTGRNCRCG